MLPLHPASTRYDTLFPYTTLCALPISGGYGMNMGIGDSVDLGWKIAAVLQGWAGPGLLESYDVERRMVARQVIDEAVANFAVFAERPSSAIEQATAEGEAMRKDLGLQLQATKRREFDSDRKSTRLNSSH